MLGIVLRAEARQQAPGEWAVHNYQNVSPGAPTVTLLVKVQDLRHATVYETKNGPR